MPDLSLFLSLRNACPVSNFLLGFKKVPAEKGKLIGQYNPSRILVSYSTRTDGWIMLLYLGTERNNVVSNMRLVIGGGLLDFWGGEGLKILKLNFQHDPRSEKSILQRFGEKNIPDFLREIKKIHAPTKSSNTPPSPLPKVSVMVLPSVGDRKGGKTTTTYPLKGCIDHILQKLK